jgi:Flp pilus assembly protein TadD
VTDPAYRAQLARAEVLVDLRRDAEAAELLIPLIAANPGDPKPVMFLAIVRRRQGSPDAETTARRAVALDPENERAHRILALTLKDCGDPDGATEAARRAVALGPGVAWTHYVLAHCLLGTNTSQALASATRAVELSPNSADMHTMVGLVQAKRGNKVEAEAAYRRALSINPEHAGAHNNLGAIALGDGRFGEAIDEFRSSAAADPRQSVARQNIDRAFKNLVVRARWILGILLFGAVAVVAVAGAGLGSSDATQDPFTMPTFVISNGTVTVITPDANPTTDPAASGGSATTPASSSTVSPPHLRSALVVALVAWGLAIVLVYRRIPATSRRLVYGALRRNRHVAVVVSIVVTSVVLVLVAIVAPDRLGFLALWAIILSAGTHLFDVIRANSRFIPFYLRHRAQLRRDDGS